MARETIDTELGTEVQCSQCREFWPADREFFYFHAGRPHSFCKACYRSAPSVVAKVARERERNIAARAARKAAT